MAGMALTIFSKYCIDFAENLRPEQAIKSEYQRLTLRSVLGVGRSIPTQRLFKHWVFDVLGPRETLQTTMAGMDLKIFSKSHHIFQNILHFHEKSAS